MHEHIVPRWTGDANFMPILAGTMVLPELIPVTYAKLRVELCRELDPGIAEAFLIVVDHHRRHLLLDEATGRLPRQRFVDDEPVWKSAIATVATYGLTAALAGWAGPRHAATSALPALIMLADDTAVRPDGATWVPLVRSGLGDADELAAVRAAASRLAATPTP